MNPTPTRSFDGLFTSVFLLLMLVLTVVGCSSVTPPPAAPPPTKQWESAELLTSLKERQENFRTLRSLAQVDYTGPDGKGGFKEAILVQRPDRLRLETLTMLGAVLIVTVDDKEIVGFHPREGVFIRGERNRKNLLLYTQLPLELNEITSLLVGIPPVESAATAELVGNELTFSNNGSKRDLLIFESALPVPTGWERYNAAGNVELKAQFSAYQSTAAGLFPAYIRVEAPFQGRTLAIRFEEPEFNATLAVDMFSQQKPAHAQELRMEALGG